MHVKPRSYLTTGIAALGAGAIALTPIQPLPGHITAAPQRAVESLAVELAATVNPFAAVVNTIKNTAANAKTLAVYYLDAPFPLAQTMLANQATYLQEILTGSAKLIPGQIKANIQTLFQAPMDPGPVTTLTNPYPPNLEATIPVANPFADIGNLTDVCTKPSGSEGCTSPAGLNLLALQVIAGASQEEPGSLGYGIFEQVVKYQSLLRFTQSFASGLLMGAAGVALSPIVSVLHSFSAFKEDLKAKQFLNAVYDIVNIPTNAVNAFFNGAGFTDLTKILEKVVGIDLSGVGNLGLNLGGLLNATPLEDPPTNKYNGGVAFDAIAAAGKGVVADNNLSGVKVGLGGAMVGMGQYLAPKLRVTKPLKSLGAAKRASAAAAVEAPTADAPKAAAKVGRKAARAAAAAKSGDTSRAGGHARAARSSR